MSITETFEITVRTIEKEALPIDGTFEDYNTIIEAAREKHIVLIGEATHGTKEFYRARSEISMRLISELGFDALAVEADWPDAYAINRYVSGSRPPLAAQDALGHFERFPTWMWANTEVLHFIQWLARFNQEAVMGGRRSRPVGFYGLDLYSMSTSAHAVIDYLEKHDPKAAERARKRYDCLSQFIHKPQLYGQAAEFGITKSCEHEITTQLIELRHMAHRYMMQSGAVDGEVFFVLSRMPSWCAMPRFIIAPCSGGATFHGTCATGTCSKRLVICWPT